MKSVLAVVLLFLSSILSAEEWGEMPENACPILPKESGFDWRYVPKLQSMNVPEAFKDMEGYSTYYCYAVSQKELKKKIAAADWKLPVIEIAVGSNLKFQGTPDLTWKITRVDDREVHWYKLEHHEYNENVKLGIRAVSDFPPLIRISIFAQDEKSLEKMLKIIQETKFNNIR